MSVNDARIITLPKMADQRGNLSFLESSTHVPFDVKRIYYLYSIPKGAKRGAHAHKKLHQFVIAISGSFEILIDDGLEKVCHVLDDPSKGLYVPPMIWRDLSNFSVNSVCLVLASDFYTEMDYFRNYDDFLKSI